MKALDIANQRFGRLQAIKRTGSDAYGKATWLFVCDCGTQMITTASLVKKGHTQSCGCLHKETAAKRWATDNEQANNRRPRGTGEYAANKQPTEQSSHGL